MSRVMSDVRAKEYCDDREYFEALYSHIQPMCTVGTPDSY